jgi:Trk K+ transport system NAD-binding subunit
MDLAVQVCTSVLVLVIAISTMILHWGVTKYSVADAFFRTISVMATGADMHEEDFATTPGMKVFVGVLRLLGVALTAAFTAILTNYLLRVRLGGALAIRRIPDSGHVIVCGLGNIGFRVIEELLSYGERVVAVELTEDNRFVATARRLGVAVVIGDATVREVLRQANAAAARAVIVTPGNDLAALEVALLVRELNPEQRVVLRLADPQLAQMLREAANVRLALSIPALAAPAFVAALFGDRVQSVFLIGERVLAVVDLTIQAQDVNLAGQSLQAVAADYRLLPVAVLSSYGKALPHTMDSQLEAGNRLAAIIGLPDLQRLLSRESAATRGRE